MFTHRTAVIKDEDIVAKRDQRQKVVRKRKVTQRGRHVKYGWGDSESIIVPSHISSGDNRDLCDHLGPCKLGSDCGCYDAETYCDRNCGCPLDCEPHLIPHLRHVE